MELNAVDNFTDPNALAGVPQKSELDKDAFLTLLVQQLKNQDPIEPASNEEFVAQLANFSSLEQMEELNENLISMVVLQQSNALMEQLTSSSALIGQTVNFIDAETLESRSGTVESVKIQDGLAVLNIDGEPIPLVDVTEVLGQTPTDLPEVTEESTETDEADTTGSDGEETN